jgi:putative PIN family toxin of toxin-antitoxin system
VGQAGDQKEKSLNPAVRIIIDSNVLISAFVKSDSPPNQLVNAWWDGRIELVTGANQIEEIVRVARYPQIQEIVKPAEIGWLINCRRDRAIIIGRLPRVEVSVDPADNYLFASAQSSDAAYLVSGDKDGVLAIPKHGACQTVRAKQMVTILKI